MADTCGKKHMKADECRLYPALCTDGKLSLSRYSMAHPPHGDVNFHEELNEAARATADPARRREGETGRNWRKLFVDPLGGFDH